MENKMCLEKYFDEITIDKIKYELGLENPNGVIISKNKIKTIYQTSKLWESYGLFIEGVIKQLEEKGLIFSLTCKERR